MSGDRAVRACAHHSTMFRAPAVISTGGDKSSQPRKLRRSKASSETAASTTATPEQRKRPRSSPIFTPDRAAAAVANSRMRSANSDNIFVDVEEEDDSDDLSDDVVQPTKRRRKAKRPSPRRTRSVETAFSSRSPSYNLSSSFSRPQQSFAWARFLPSQYTIPVPAGEDEEERPLRTTFPSPPPVFALLIILLLGGTYIRRASSQMAHSGEHGEEGATKTSIPSTSRLRQQTKAASLASRTVSIHPSIGCVDDGGAEDADVVVWSGPYKRRTAFPSSSTKGHPTMEKRNPTSRILLPQRPCSTPSCTPPPRTDTPLFPVSFPSSPPFWSFASSR